MSMNEPVSEVAVDRRQETVVTQQPGYASTQQITRDVAAERRLMFFQIMRIVWAALGLLEILLGLRFFLKLIAANADSGFASLIYSLSGVFTAPFAGIVTTPVSGATVLEVTTLIAMMVYVLFVWIVVKVIGIVADRPSARSSSQSVQVQMPDGSIRTTRNTKIG